MADPTDVAAVPGTPPRGKRRLISVIRPKTMRQARKVGKKTGGGGASVPINIPSLIALRRAQCSIAECAAFLGISDRTLQRRMKRDPQVREAMETSPAVGRAVLRMKQFSKATTGQGDRTLLIWLGKQHLGQAEKVEQTTEVKSFLVEAPARAASPEDWATKYDPLAIREAASGEKSDDEPTDG